MKKSCELCKSMARVYCESDQASLCFECDAKVHGANFLVARHSRALLCRSCHVETAWRAEGPRLGPTVSVCNCCAMKTMGSSDDDEEDEEEDDNEEEEEDDDEMDSEEGDEVAEQVVPAAAAAAEKEEEAPEASESSRDESGNVDLDYSISSSNYFKKDQLPGSSSTNLQIQVANWKRDHTSSDNEATSGDSNQHQKDRKRKNIIHSASHRLPTDLLSYRPTWR